MSDEEADVTMEGAVEEVVDVPMEEVKVEIVDVSDVVHEWMKNKLPNVEIERANMLVSSDINASTFFAKWSQAYPSAWESVPAATHDALYAAVKDRLERGAEGSDRIERYPTDKELDALERAFTAEFVGDAHVRLFKYIQLCWKRYGTQAQRFCYPFIAIVQSSGFGKSRVLRECARKGSEINRTKPNRERFHLMYVCARNIPGSTGFPVETARLRDHLFPHIDEDKPTATLVDAMSKKLVQLFDFVI